MSMHTCVYMITLFLSVYFINNYCLILIYEYLYVYSWTFVVDRSDRSVARCKEYLYSLFPFAGVRILTDVQQTDFPEELYPVYMIALVPTNEVEEGSEL